MSNDAKTESGTGVSRGVVGLVRSFFGRGDSFAAFRRRLGFVDLLASFVLASYVLLLTNVIIFRRPVRIDLTMAKEHTLSKATLKRLDLVSEQILVVIPTFLQTDNPTHAAQREVLARARSLLNEYTAAQPLIRIAAEVDVFAEPDRWDVVRQEYGLSASQVNRFLFFAGASHEFRQSVTPQDMASFLDAKDPVTAMPSIKNFRAEKAMTDAITRLIERTRRVVYFTQGHGELSWKPAAAGGKTRSEAGINALVHELDTEGMEAKELSLQISRSVPSNCELLVIAGATQPFSAEEIDTVRRYLRRGGHLFVAVGRTFTGIEDLLGEWGAKVLPGTIRGWRASRNTSAATDFVQVHSFNAAHPITRVFRDLENFGMTLLAPRALRSTGIEKGLDSTVLLETGDVGEGESYFLLKKGESVVGKRPESFPVAIAVKQLVTDRPPPGFQKVGYRIVVVGARNFLSNSYFPRGSNRDFFLNSVAWLLGEEQKATAGGQDWSRSVLPANPSIGRFLFWIPVVLLPVFFLAVGAFVYMLRRS